MNHTYTDVEFEEEFVIVASYEPHDGWVLVDETDVEECAKDWDKMAEEHARRARERAVNQKFSKELLSMATLTGRSVAELAGTWADIMVNQVKQSGRTLKDVSQSLKEQIHSVIQKKAEPDIVLNPNAYRDVEPCFPPARIV